MKSEHVTQENLAAVLEEFATQMCRRFSNLLKHQNQHILEYCDQCLESVSKMQELEHRMLTTIDTSLNRMEDQVITDLKRVLRPGGTLRAMKLD